MKRWYIIHAYSGYEKQVMRSLKERIQRSAVADSFGDVLVPTRRSGRNEGW
ncbi:transcription antitermination protein [Acinetobacter baumannii ZW85-1]|nr:transcription antitermination protein [Acinetobacter baumannii ZW85-1]